MNYPKVAHHMSIGEMIDRLRKLPDDVLVPRFGAPHSYRGYYEDVAFEILGGYFTRDAAVAELMGALGETFTGYKGGDYVCTKDTHVWIAEYGCLGRPVLSVSNVGRLGLGEYGA